MPSANDAVDAGAQPRTASVPARVLVRRGAPTGGDPQPPTSKYYTLRYTLAAALAGGESIVRDPARSDDTDVLVVALRRLGARITWERADGASDAAQRWHLRIGGCAGRPRTPPDGVLPVGNAGAVLRMLLGVGAMLPEVRFVTPYPDSLGQRPNADLLAALEQLGIASEAREPRGCLPITLRGGPPAGGPVSVSGARSSQYLSALLFLAPLTKQGLRIRVTEGLRSAPLIRATLRALTAAGIRLEAASNLMAFEVPGEQAYRSGDYAVPGDGPSAAALAAAALVRGMPLRLDGLDAGEEDVRAMLEALAALGATITPDHAAADENGQPELRVNGGALHGAEIDGDACIDSVPALVAAACFAAGETRFERVATLRLKESDRIGDLCAELTRAGCDVRPEPDAIMVRGQPEGIEGGVTVYGHQDHRLVQALAIAALGSRAGLTIEGADHVAKSYPWFFADLARLGAKVTAV
jgi:3-phosphoshikimate 1-carboxyvinyltransferase